MPPARMTATSASPNSLRPSARNSTRHRVRRPSVVAYPPRSRKLTAPSRAMTRSVVMWSRDREVPQREPAGQVALNGQVDPQHGADAQFELGVASLLGCVQGREGIEG